MGGKRKRSEGLMPVRQVNKTAGKATQYAPRKKKSSNAIKPSGLTMPKLQKKTEFRTVANSNWLALKSTIQRKDQLYKRGKTIATKQDLNVVAQKQLLRQEKLAKRMKERTTEWVDNSMIVAMDCEMVGVGLSGKTSVLARCSLVNYHGAVLYDQYVRPVEKVTDFRTHVSGIKSSSLRHAIPFKECIKDVGKLLENKIVIGHALQNDFQALMFTPPKQLIRDTAFYRPYMRRKMKGTKLYPKALKHLAAEVLGLEIQTGQHDSVEDARAALELYKREQYVWEKYLRMNRHSGILVGVAPPVPELDENQCNKISSTAQVHLDVDEEEPIRQRGNVAGLELNELAIMEFGE
ncbi:hypothetical protein CCR75_005734 [Bremia lactucae]|uniref:RNA exonuclease 4 n=1 Tax=Bremia lactucae TaxID=4779 RepID=A0A976FQK5_BRELC|nr:hypothetical protein CCR75_005736 [Bremia lactucae]TDH71095.1 hypothetical protein CCR75_005734 [Bremia lactucae]